MTLFVPLLILGSIIRKNPRKPAPFMILYGRLAFCCGALASCSDGGTIVLFGNIELPPIVFIGIMVLVILVKSAPSLKSSKEAPLEAEAEKKRLEEQQQEIAHGSQR